MNSRIDKENPITSITVGTYVAMSYIPSICNSSSSPFFIVHTSLMPWGVELWQMVRWWRLWQSLLVKRYYKSRMGRSWGDMKLWIYRCTLLHSRWKTKGIKGNAWSNTELILIPFLSHSHRCIRLYGCSWPSQVSSLHHPVPRGQRKWALSGIRKALSSIITFLFLEFQ